MDDVWGKDFKYWYGSNGDAKRTGAFKKKKTVGDGSHSINITLYNLHVLLQSRICSKHAKDWMN